jgi:hypothetical protein
VAAPSRSTGLHGAHDRVGAASLSVCPFGHHDRKERDMTTPRLSGYPIDTAMLRAAQRDRARRRAIRAERRTTRTDSDTIRRWLAWLV